MQSCSLTVCYVTGGQDKQGRPILTFPCHVSPDKLRYEELLGLLTYLSRIPRLVLSLNAHDDSSFKHGIMLLQSITLSFVQNTYKC